MSAPALDDHLCFALYSASRAMTAAYRPLLGELGLTYPQYLVLLVVRDEGPVSVGRIGERLQLDSGTLSPLLKRMESAGILHRQRSGDDERQVDVTLTAAGHTVAARAECIPEKLFPATGLTIEQMTELREAITTLTQTLVHPHREETS